MPAKAISLNGRWPARGQSAGGQRQQRQCKARDMRERRQYNVSEAEVGGRVSPKVNVEQLAAGCSQVTACPEFYFYFLQVCSNS